ncbi:hypothetical protein D3C81_2095490 [compost metagenome]
MPPSAYHFRNFQAASLLGDLALTDTTSPRPAGYLNSLAFLLSFGTVAKAILKLRGLSLRLLALRKMYSPAYSIPVSPFRNMVSVGILEVICSP